MPAQTCHAADCSGVPQVAAHEVLPFLTVTVCVLQGLQPALARGMLVALAAALRRVYLDGGPTRSAICLLHLVFLTDPSGAGSAVSLMWPTVLKDTASGWLRR